MSSTVISACIVISVGEVSVTNFRLDPSSKTDGFLELWFRTQYGRHNVRCRIPHTRNEVAPCTEDDSA
eukprot:5179155-Pyramimonas_sp.AAC.1